jgi:transposase
MNASKTRKQKGYEIAQQNQIKITKDGWLVESQSGNGFYKVSNEFMCNCPDSELHMETCKHAFAVRYYLNIEKKTRDGIEVEKIPLTYPQAWSIYNEAQASEGKLFYELLGDLVRDLEDPELIEVPRRPRLKFSNTLYLTIAKVYSQLSCRRANSLFGMVKEKANIQYIPHFNAVSVILNREDITPILQELVATTSAPLKSVESQFAVDSSGFRTRSFTPYIEDKYGTKKEHKWIKAHICVGTKTNIITALKITEGYGSDSKEFIQLAQQTKDNGFDIREISADKAYSSRDNLTYIDSIGGTAFIPFKSNSRAKPKGSRIWNKMYHYFNMNKDDFMLHYHKRSNVESTFASIKRKLGDTLKSKNSTAQINELLCKIIAYNITVLIQEMHELGINVDFA